MASASAQSAAIAKIKKLSKGAFNKSKKKEAKVKGSTLPGGLIRGVCELRGIKFDIMKDKNKTPYVSLPTVVHSPSEFKGAQHTMTTPFRTSKDPKTGEVYKTIEQRWDEVVSNLKLFGIDESKLEAVDEDDLEELIALVKATLKKKKLYAYFNTFRPEKKKGDQYEPRTFMMLQGIADPPDDEDEEEVEDDEDDQDEEDDEEEKKPTRKPGRKKPAAKEEAEDEDESEDEDEGESDEDAEDSEDEEEYTPEVDDVYGYKPPKSKKVYECAVVKVNAKKQTVDLKRASDEKEFKGVPFDDLVEAPNEE